jgi:flagellar motor protein MotB
MFLFFKHIKWSLVMLGLCCAFCITSNAQQLSSSSKKAVKAYNKGYEKYTKRQYAGALTELKNAVKIDAKFVEAHLMMAECYMETGEPQLAKASFLRCAEINPNFFPPVYYSLAEIEYEAGEYEAASQYLEKFLTYSRQRPALIAKSEKLLQNSRFAAHATKNPVPFQPENLGLEFEYDQYWPSLSVDEQTLVFTALIPKNPDNTAVVGNRHEDFFVSELRDGKWTTPENLGSPPNTPDNEGAQTISADATRMFFTACNRSDGKGGCDIYYSEKRNGLWTRPRNLGAPVNTSAKETQPSVSADGRTLYFVSTRSGGKGGQDIWMSTLDGDGSWSNPVNLEEINTSGDESSPFIHLDNQTLYFASDGLPGMGGYDLFVTRKDSAGKWTTPVNLGYPINSRHNEEGMIVNARGDRAYYSSDRGEGHIRNIYTFELYPDARPQPVSYMKGKIYDARYLKPLKALFELIDLSSPENVVRAYSDSMSGEFLVCIPSGKDYALNIRCKGYLFFSEHFTMTGGTYREPLLKDIPLKRIQPGEKVILKNIFFEISSSKLLDESKAELQQLAQFLRDNPEVNIRITGHTDSTGRQAYNLDLSRDRARSVTNYLLSEGIAMARVSYRGLGSSEPIADNDTEEGRAQNRRTELLIVK